MKNWIDKIVSYVSPTRGAERAKARLKLELMEQINGKRKYEGASRGRRTEGWVTSATSADTEILSSLELLRARSRDLVRNNPFASSAVRVISHNMVGTGITPHFKGSNKRTTKLVESLAVEHLDTEAIDADGRHDLYGLEGLWTRTIVESGSVLIRRRFRRPEDGLPLPFQLQTMEPDFLDTGKNVDLSGGRFIRGGVEFDALGRRSAYWLFPAHPGDGYRYMAMDSVRVPASEVAHVFRVDRPGQTDGVPWAAPVIIRLRDFDDFEDAQLLRQKIAAAFAVFVVDNDFGPAPADPNGNVNSNPIIDSIQPGAVELLPNGKDVRFPNPPSLGGYSEYSSISLHAIASGYGVPYEALTGDLKGVNFSSGRMGWLEFQRNLDCWRWQMLIPQALKPVERWFIEAINVSRGTVGSIETVWSPPWREMIDPTKEVPAIRDAVRAGQITLSESLRMRGYDPVKFLEEFAADMEMVDSLRLVFDSDPRKTSRSGGAVEHEEANDNVDTSEGGNNA